MKFNEKAEYAALTDEQRRCVEQVIADVRSHGATAQIRVNITDQAYAYPHPGGGIAWGINGGEHGFCLARGIRS